MLIKLILEKKDILIVTILITNCRNYGSFRERIIEDFVDIDEVFLDLIFRA